MTTLSIFISATFRTFCHKILQKQIEDTIVKRKYVVTLAECIDTLKKQGKHIFRQQKNCVNNKNIFYTLSSSKASVSYDFCSRVIVKTMVSISGVVVVVLRLISLKKVYICKINLHRVINQINQIVYCLVQDSMETHRIKLQNARC